MNRSTINLHLGDSLEAMKLIKDNAYDLAIVDPPYGIDIAKWDAIDMKPPKEYFDELMRISKNQIIWGANYFYLPHSESWLCWHKLKGLNKGLGTMSEFELAWTSHNNKAKYLGYTYLGNTEGFNKPKPNYKIGKRIHPTQKPVKLYEWLLTNYAKEGDKILDTHGGSMSIALACHNLKFDLDLWELDEYYHAAGVKRFEQHKKQLQLF